MNDLLFRLIELSGKGYCCSQIMLILGLENQGKENPDLVRAMNGLCMGVASSGGTCGVFSGAACLLSLYAGKGADDETENEKLPLMLSALTDWFSETVGGRYGGIQCADIIGEGAAAPDTGRCGEIMTETYGRVLEILMENDIDPAGVIDE
ncbi:hypothetical protein DENIS_0370 [Desulfonema ishimotonii]|uniref:C_GCAxxG_C_C family protein n=1 Tax=Desulfonema ishimotonii TaxID=45657 RepID=A0A401FR44_9BACT|nr:DV_1555 family C-GCAxxG-C-C protein [Desulfonema ishimotonii]GBC59431.1 hypothetical protein DENIS_0370 [Desulfonema ishimotonii]